MRWTFRDSSLRRRELVFDLKRTPCIPNHCLPYQRNGWPSEAEELVVELFPGGPAPACRAPVIAQFANHEFAHGVVKIGGVKGPPGRLLAGRCCVLKAILTEQPLGL